MYKYLNHSRSPFMPPYPEKIFYDDNEKAFTERMSGKELPPPAQGSDMLKAVVLKACAYDPASRYKSAAEMLEDLEEIQYGSLNKRKRNRAARKASGRQPDKRTRRQKAGFAAAYICLLLATIAATYISVPKEVTDIQGIDSNVSLYYDASLRPQYEIEPKWFEDEKISFKSGDESVFKVSDTGIIEAVSIGEADLTMKAREYTETVHVSVVPKVTEIGGVDKNYNLITGGEIRISQDLEPDKFADEDIDYSSDNEAVATVSDSGTIKAVSAGTADITIRAGGASFKSKITVSNPQPVIRYNTSSKSKKKSSGKSKSSPGTSDGYFESGDDEHF